MTIDLVSVRFGARVGSHGLVDALGVRRDGTTVLVGTVEDAHPDIAREFAEALEALGVAVDRTGLPPETGPSPTIHFAAMRVSTGDDGSDWTDLETRSSSGKYATASVPEEFDVVLERLAGLHPRP